MMGRIHIPRINDKLSDFRKLFDIKGEFDRTAGEVIFDFSNCGALMQNAVAFLGGLARIGERNGKKVTFDWETMNKSVYRNLDQNGFTFFFGYGEGPIEGNAIPYREELEEDANDVIEYLQHKWLGRGWVNVSNALRDAIVGKMWEIYANAFEHGHSEIGIISCGQHYPRNHELKLTVIDFGIGIPYNVKRFLGNYNMGTEDALKWAFTSGNSTRVETSGPRGLGLDLLKNFVKINGGKLEVYSSDGYVLFSKDDEYYKEIVHNFSGTIINLSLICNEEKYYFLSSEKE